jgi:serine phosphatase RsbU (regulator of sigma subunit)/integral membrane sensor domain MASE1
VLGELTVGLILGNSPAVSAGYSLANVTGTFVGAWLTLRWCGGIPDLRIRRHLALFVAGACLIGPALGGLIGGATIHLTDPNEWVGNVLCWWAGDGLGVLIAATPILLWAKQSSIVWAKPRETATVLALTAAASTAAFLWQAGRTILILPILAWAALQLDMLGAALAGLVMACAATVTASHGNGAVYSATLSPSAGLMLNQLLVAVLTTVALVVAQEASARVEAVREREIERRDRIQLQGLSALAQQMSAALTPEDIGRALESHVIKEVGAQGVSLGLLSAEGNLVWAVATGYPDNVREEFSLISELDAPLLGTDVVRAGRPVMIRSQDEYEARYGSSVRWLTMGGTHSIAGWPLTGGGKPFGALIVIWAEPQQFDVAQVAYLSAVTTLVSQALVRAQIYADEHARAAVLQSALVPDNPVHTGSLDVCMVYQPADVTEGLGGDWYDVLSLPGDRMYFAVGDVIGHGLPAVEDMAQLRTAGRALAHYGLPPAQLLADLNAFTRRASQGKFATMFVAVFDFASGELTYGSAGHPPALLRRASTGSVLELSDAAGTVLGPLVETSYVEGSVRICPNDVLLMYTDGLVERIGMDLDVGISAAQRLIAEWEVDSDLAGKCEELHKSLSPEPRKDDLCIIAVRFPGRPVSATQSAAPR